MRKEKLRKAGHCFLTGCFIKVFKMIINHFFLFLKLIHNDISGIKRGNWERQISRNGKSNIHFKNNSNIFVMNVTQLNFLN